MGLPLDQPEDVPGVVFVSILGAMPVGFQTPWYVEIAVTRTTRIALATSSVFTSPAKYAVPKPARTQARKATIAFRADDQPVCWRMASTGGRRNPTTPA